VSVRTLYRDIASLRAQGAVIEGEPGVGYVLRPGFLLPPLMFTPEEIDALVLGAKWVERHTDQALVAAVGTALSKITSVLPVVAHTEFESSGLFAEHTRHLYAAVSGSFCRHTLTKAIAANHPAVVPSKGPA